MSHFVANLLALLGYENTNAVGEGLEPALAAYDAMVFVAKLEAVLATFDLETIAVSGPVLTGGWEPDLDEEDAGVVA